MSQASYRTIPVFLASRENFIGNSMTANRLVGPLDRIWGLGLLPDAWRMQFRADERDHGLSYVVFSYATPIAWVRRDGVVVIPDVKYSATTSRGQHLCRIYLPISGYGADAVITKIGA